MAPQPTPPSPYSPEIQAWLMNLGPFPFGEAQIPLPPGSFGDEDQMDFMGDVLTTQNKANNVISDPAQIAQFGTGAGGFSPDAFQPVISYEPVKAPGYMQMQRYKVSEDPFMRLVARRLDEGASAVQIEEEIATLINDGDQEMAAAVPKTRVDMNAGGVQLKVPTIDWGRISSITSGLEKAIIEDPEFNAKDPQTGLPANEIREETEASRYFREMNLPNPYEKFSPDLLADQPTLDRENQVARVGKPRADREAQAASERYVMLVKQLKGTKRATPFDDGMPDDFRRPTGFYEDTPVGKSNPWAGSVRDQRYSHPEGRTPIYEPSLLTNTDTANASGFTPEDVDKWFGMRRRKAGREMLDTGNERTRMNNKHQDDKTAAWERQRMIDAMTRAGYTPFNEVMRSRQSPIYGR